MREQIKKGTFVAYLFQSLTGIRPRADSLNNEHQTGSSGVILCQVIIRIDIEEQ